MVKLFEEQKGKSFEVQLVPDEDIRAQKENAQDPLQISFSSLMLTYAGGAELPMEETLKHMPVKLASLKDYRNKLLGLDPVAV